MSWLDEMRKWDVGVASGETRWSQKVFVPHSRLFQDALPMLFGLNTGVKIPLRGVISEPVSPQRFDVATDSCVLNRRC